QDEDIIDKCDIIFTSLPHGLSEKFAGKCLANGVKMIDLGADFRLDSAEEYTNWYGKKYEDEALHTQSLYCIPELHRANYKGQTIIGNPGCYPTSIALGLAPAIKLAVDDTIVIDSKSGVTGAGRGLADNTHYPNCNEAFAPYKVASHRHTPEIEQTLSKLCGKKVNVTFVPHLLPVNRGIVSTIYFNVNKPVTAVELRDIYADFYKNEKFVRVLELGEVANLRNVKYSNYCDISLHFDEHTNRAIVVSTIDNMVKGAAGQAIQNMNIMFGLEEASGLDYVPPAF
ncbi:MAG: N-acetyl-gamma-glutamyl-phosphate reductase, partial [Clostridia bacterium]|nr:N-acetyl-gamma-glutamyl-phosphate reductase [Clostridia bacterium]